MIYGIVAENFNNLSKKLTKISKKCEKYNNEFKFEVIGERFVTVKDPSTHKEYVIKYIDIDVEGKAIVNDWEFAATIQHTESGNIITGVPGIEIPERYYTVAPRCEHCNSNRHRNDTYLVRNTITGEFKQVGRTCLKDFTNGLDAELVALYESYIHEVEEASEISFGSFNYTRYYDIVKFVEITAELVNRVGFVSASNGDFDRPSTKVVVGDIYDYSTGRLSGKLEESIERYINKIGFKFNNNTTIEEAHKALEWIRNLEDVDFGYMSNLKTVCSSDYIESRNFGIAASLITAYKRAMDFIKKNEEKENELNSKKSSEFFGNIKDKIELNVISSKRVGSYENEYGVTNIYEFIDSNNNVFIWKTGNDIPDNVRKIKGTIKDHSEYRGVKQTILTRCKVIEFEEVQHEEGTFNLSTLDTLYA